MSKEAARKLIRLHEKLDKQLGESNNRVQKYRDTKLKDDVENFRLAMELDRADLLAKLLTEVEDIILDSMTGGQP